MLHDQLTNPILRMKEPNSADIIKSVKSYPSYTNRKNVSWAVYSSPGPPVVAAGIIFHFHNTRSQAPLMTSRADTIGT